MRLTKNEYYIGIAKAVSRRSTCLRRQYGAVIVNRDEIVSTGYNGSPRGEANCCDTGICYREGHAHNDGDYSSCCSVHAEMNAIISASRAEMIGATLYLAGFENGEEIVAEPCPVCERLIKNAGIRKVVCGHMNEYLRNEFLIKVLGYSEEDADEIIQAAEHLSEAGAPNDI